MSEIVIDGRICKIHPTYDLYAADIEGNIYSVKRKVRIAFRDHHGYLLCTVRKSTSKTQKNYRVHRFLWECFNGLILNGKVIDHINDIKHDNRLCNLQLLTQQENCKKSAKNRDNSFLVNNFKNKKSVKATNCQTGVVRYFPSINNCRQRLGITSCQISYICKGRKYYKTALSLKDCCSYTFEYYKPE